MESKEFKAGQKWRMRGGEIATISGITKSGRPLPSWGNKSSLFTTNGRFYWFLDQESEFDLIELVEDVAPAPAAQLTRDQLLAENETLRDDLNDARNSLEAAAEELREADVVRAQLVGALREARRAIGDHYAPIDCYATGPLTGDHIRDLVQCPACSAIAMYDAALTAAGAA
jgi:hypothetical protein